MFMTNPLIAGKTSSIIVVSGLPRSGTSMMMAMLQAGGVELISDGIRKPDIDNPRGYFELEAVKRLAKNPDTTWLAGSNGKVVKVVSSLLKHLPSLYQYDVIFMNRDLKEIMASQRKMLERRGEDKGSQDDARIEMLFERHLQEIKDWLRRQINFRLMEVAYRDALANPQDQARRVEDFLKRKLSLDAMSGVVTLGLYRNRNAALGD
jgi:hypothetical protein